MTFKETFEKLKRENHPLLNGVCKVVYMHSFPPYQNIVYCDQNSINNEINEFGCLECEVTKGSRLTFLLRFPKLTEESKKLFLLELKKIREKIPKTY